MNGKILFSQDTCPQYRKTEEWRRSMVSRDQRTMSWSRTTSWILRRRLLPHGQQLLSYSRLGIMWRLSHVLAGVYEKSAKLFEYNKAYEEAAELLERAVNEEEKDPG